MEPGRTHILVVEDDADCREAVAEYLDVCGHEVSTAADGLAALAALAGPALPDLLLVDLKMPRMDGEQLIAALRADRRLADLPVIVLTGSVERPHPEGALAVVEKPFTPDALHAAIGDALAWARGPLAACGK